MTTEQMKAKIEELAQSRQFHQSNAEQSAKNAIACEGAMMVLEELMKAEEAPEEPAEANKPPAKGK